MPRQLKKKMLTKLQSLLNNAAEAVSTHDFFSPTSINSLDLHAYQNEIKTQMNCLRSVTCTACCQFFSLCWINVYQTNLQYQSQSTGGFAVVRLVQTLCEVCTTILFYQSISILQCAQTHKNRYYRQVYKIFILINYEIK